MQSPKILAGLWVTAACAVLMGCENMPPLGVDPADSAEVANEGGRSLEGHGRKNLDIALCSSSSGGFTTASTNPYFPMEVGDQWAYEGEEDGVPVSLLITVLNETRVVDGVTTRVIEEREWEDEELLEVSWNYYVQAGGGTICYFGEDVDIYEEGEIVHEGAWCADEPQNAPGIFIPADPKPGMKYPMELAPGIAEDEGKIVGIGPVTVPAGRFTETIRVREFNPLDGGKGYKVFAAGTGLIVDGPLELVDLVQGAPTPGPPTITEQVCGS